MCLRYFLPFFVIFRLTIHFEQLFCLFTRKKGFFLSSIYLQLLLKLELQVVSKKILTIVEFDK